MRSRNRKKDIDHMEALHRRLHERAVALGASDAALIPADEIVVRERFARYCQEPKCPNYGRSASCPPHVEGPDAFKQWRGFARHGLVIRIDAPVSRLFDEGRSEVLRLLHAVVAGVELEAMNLSYPRARGFAGGSCKQLFCPDQKSCLRLSERGVCRNPLVARPSLSGFGVDVGAMMKSAGWPNGTIFDADVAADDMSWVAGLVLLIGRDGNNRERV